ncbi:MAG: hypothetical protein Q8880_13695, partial [Bacteroidota bacterium]|nr:hypothetical protein [Bacteroidota bacterium]
VINLIYLIVFCISLCHFHEDVAANNKIQTESVNLYSIKVGNSFIRPGDYEKNINLFGLLGKPINEEYCKSISPDYPLGIEYRTLFYDGIRIDFYKSKNGLYKICGINVWNNKYPTSLGIKLGDNLTKLKTVYPNLEVDYDIYFYS